MGLIPSFPVTRFFVERMGLAHILDILSSERARIIESMGLAYTVDISPANGPGP